MLGLAALILASASANVSPALTSAAPWWEKVTFTITGDGAQQSCNYESSLAFAGAQGCGDSGEEDSSSSMAHSASSSDGSYTKITVERRFTPAAAPERVSLQPGDTLLGGQVMAIAINGNGAVSSCRIVGASGDMRPPYGCDEARAERFEASAGRASGQIRHAYMTVLVYGHEEYPV